MNRLVKLCVVPAVLLASFAMTSTASAGHHGHHHHHNHHHKHHFGHFHAHKVIVPVHVPKVIVVPSYVPVYKHCHGGFCY